MGDISNGMDDGTMIAYSKFLMNQVKSKFNVKISPENKVKNMENII